MKIAVSATSPTLDADIDPRFGRCAYFIFIETDDMSFEAVENTNAMLSNGAGIQSAQLVAEKGAGFILTGKCGPNSQHALSAAGIVMITDCSGNVKDNVENFKKGQLTAASPESTQTGPQQGLGVSPSGNVPRRSMYGGGSGMGMGMGRGGGRGRGMGGCRGGGMGGGRGRGMGGMTGVYMDERMASRIPAESGGADEIEDLKSSAEYLKQQLADIERKINEMEEKHK